MSSLPFSEAFETNDLIFVSGQIPLDESGKLIDASIEDQVHQTMKNIQKVLKEKNLDLSSVVMTYIYLTDLKNIPVVSDTYISYFTQPYPARVTLGVKELPMGSKMEISVIASKK